MRIALSLLLSLGLGAVANAQPAPFATFDKASPAELADPHDLTFGPDGRLYVADKFASSIAVLDPETLEIVDRFGGGELAGVHDISFGADGKAYVAATGTSTLVVYGFEGGVATLEAAFGPFSRTEGALAHSNGRTYVMASGTGQLFVLQGSELVTSLAGFPGAHDIAEAADGSIWVADNGQSRLVRLSPDLEILQTLDDPKFGFIGPRYLDIDDFGRLIVADQDAHRVLLIDPRTESLEGVIGDGVPGIGPGKFDDPEGVAVRGDVYYFSDSDNNRVVRYVVVIN